ncbi:biotin transporter BioY [Methanobrevibacter curvatus]|uniref:Biotin transporter BioY n=1 Tax=Methanobrevibacter curvatus TaxID=49547 RepID=A0A166EIM4_9EURY|nr:biotin transporter BioY [Methanobrevibacter curvatus]KZX16692.1 biotin transporter BioY [Methanobrevibacter curvatus]
MEINLDNYYFTREKIYNRIHESNTVEKIVMVFLMAALTGLAAQIVIPLPWTPIPITFQTFAVLVAGLLLGKKMGALSQIVYLALGTIGLPWFAETSGGLSVILGANCGYFIGFIIAAYFVGYLSEKYSKSRKFRFMTLTMLIANFACIYIPGLLILAIWCNFNMGGFPNIYNLLIMGLIPFIAGDLVKVLSASAVSKLFLPK